MASLGQAGVIQVVPPAVLEAQLEQQAQAGAAAQDAAMNPTAAPPQLAAYVKTQFEIMRNHRNTAAGWSERLLSAFRMYNGQYDATKLAAIRKFGGSEIFARMIAQKCRAASSLLRDIYLSQDMPWGLRPPADPDIPEDIQQSIDQLITSEAQMVTQTLRKPPDQSELKGRREALMNSARDAAKDKAFKQAHDSELKIEEILRDGGFYRALAEFLVDLPIFPFACIKGPVVKVIPTVVWSPGGGMPTVQQKPKLVWVRVNPFDMWWTPGVADIANADVIEKIRYTRAELNDLLDLPGYDQEAVRTVLDEYGRGGLYDAWDTTDAERANLESRENPAWNRSGMITGFEFNGNVQGRVLQEYGLAVPDEIRDYHVQIWCIGTHVIKCQLSPSPRQRHPYFITSFEKVPGSPIGNGLTDLLADVQEVSNATLRALVNNLGIASGPQVVINDDRVMSEENTEELYPWKRWHTRNDPVGTNSAKPIEFYQPNAIAQQLLEVFAAFTNIADDVSAIPKYIGGQSGSGAGRTASGLAMLMGNASKILQSVSANIDRDVVELALMQLSDLILLTDTSGLLTGEEQITVRGVNVAIQRETQRQRQIEFLQATANPIDQKIIGVEGRGKVLRAISRDIGLDGESIVPEDEKLQKMAEEQAKAAQGGPTMQAVEGGVMKGIEAGVKKMTTTLTEAGIAQQTTMDDELLGGPGVSTPPQENGPPSGKGSPLNGGGTPRGGPPPQRPQGGGMDRAARQAQGNKPRPLSRSMGPQTHVVGNQPGPGAKPVRGGVG